eukprot:gene36402-biopygen21105
MNELQHASWHVCEAAEKAHLQERARAAIADYLALLDAAADTRQLVDTFAQRIEGSSRMGAAEEILMNMFAGVETTTAVLAWLVDRIGVNQRAQDRLHDEWRTGEGAIYRRCFINETMRYFPPIPFVIRAVGEDTNLNGERLEKGRQILVSLVGVHHDPRHWRDPQVFDASRAEFLDD